MGTFFRLDGEQIEEREAEAESEWGNGGAGRQAGRRPEKGECEKVRLHCHHTPNPVKHISPFGKEIQSKFFHFPFVFSPFSSARPLPAWCGLGSGNGVTGVSVLAL